MAHLKNMLRRRHREPRQYQAANAVLAELHVRIAAGCKERVVAYADKHNVSLAVAVERLLMEALP
jgi:hypothetical protein